MYFPNETEKEALEIAAEAGGAYLEKIGKFDLTQMDREEYMTFMTENVRAYLEHLGKLSDEVAA